MRDHERDLKGKKKDSEEKREGQCGSCFSLFLECLGCFRLQLGKPYWVGTDSLWEKGAR